MNANDGDPSHFCASATGGLTFVVLNNISQQPLDGSPWNLVHTFISPNYVNDVLWIIITLADHQPQLEFAFSAKS